MHEKGWKVSPICRLFVGKSISISNCTWEDDDNDYVWFAEFCKEEVLKK